MLEYQTQQHRLIPHLVNLYAILVFRQWLSNEHRKSFTKKLMGDNVTRIDLEMHALSSVAKAICSWAARDGIQECREACGGHGYLKMSQLGELRNDNDANCTYEGENNVLQQQASNWLVNIRRAGYRAFVDNSPLGTASFLADAPEILTNKFRWTSVEQVMEADSEWGILPIILGLINSHCRSPSCAELARGLHAGEDGGEVGRSQESRRKSV